MRARRRAATVVVLLLVLILGGCTRGTVDMVIDSDEMVHLDATTDVDDLSQCQVTASPSLTIETASFEGRPACHLVAHWSIDDPETPVGQNLVRRVDEGALVALGPWTQGSLQAFQPSGSSWPGLNYDAYTVTVTFPGPVTYASGGTVSGSTVTWTLPNRDGAAPVAVGRIQPRPPIEIWVGIAGFLAGITVVGVGVGQAILRARS